MMVAALLFSRAGVALNFDLFEKFESGKYHFEEPNLGGYSLEKVGEEWWITLGTKSPTDGPNGGPEAGYLCLVLEFDEGEIEDIGFTAIEIKYTNDDATTEWASGKIGMQVYRLGVGEGTNEGLDLPVGKYFLPDEDISEITGIGIMGLWFNEPGNVIRIKRLEGIVEISVPVFNFFNPVNFGDYKGSLVLDDYSIMGYMGAIPPFGLNSGLDWPEADEGWATFVQDAESVILKVKGTKGETSSPAGTVCAFRVNLDPHGMTGKTFGDVENIKFNYKLENNDGWCEGYEYAIVVVSRDNRSNGEYIEYFADGDFEFVRHPAVFYSTDGVGEAESCGVWGTFSMETAWFGVEDGKSDNARFWVGDGYTPDLGSLEYEKTVWISVGLNTWDTYYINDIELVFKCEGPDCVNSVEKVTVSPVNVFSIPGGLAIQGAEKATVYGIDGSLIATVKGDIALPKGVYIVKAGNQVVKAIVK
jgi:hypothetical protein